MTGSRQGIGREVLVAALGGAGATIIASLMAAISPPAQAFLTRVWEIRVWETYAIICIALVLGTVFGLIVGHHKGATKAEEAPAAIIPQTKPETRLPPAPPRPKLASATAPGAFDPTPLHSLCIRALRFKDDEYQSIGDIALVLQQIGHPTPRSDIGQALTDLCGESWASQMLKYPGGWHYKLIGRGITYAREHAFGVEGLSY